MQKLDFIYQRHSVRKFKDQSVDPTHLQEMIKAATYAPSGKNVQNWHFVVLNNKEKIQEIVKIVEDRNEALASWTNDENLKKEISKFKGFHTVFRGAPSLVFVFAGPYRDMAVDAYRAKNASSEEIHSLLRVAPAVQNISAALQNLMLAAAALGYGTCWMTGPSYAFNEIHKYLGFEKEGYFLAAMTPLGVPEEKELSSPSRKPIDEVLTIID